MFYVNVYEIINLKINYTMKKLPGILLIALAFCLVSPVLYSQEDVVKMLSGNLNDAEKLSKEYLEPFGKSLGTSLNNGWYNSAKPHKLFGFDITFTAAITVPPSGDRKFDVSKLNLEYWELQDPNDNMAPTVTGEKTGGPRLVDQATGTSASIDLPQGANLRFIPAPIVQVGVGLPFHTEIMGRFFPKVDISGVGNFSLWGVGIKNEFKEFIPVFKRLPIDVSILLGYTKLKSSFDIKSNQTLDFEATGFTGKLLISKSIPVLTVYAGVGYNKSNTDVALKGTYEATIAGVNQSIKDPLSLDFSNSGVNANIGLRIKLALIAFHFDYALGKYSILNAGVGINFR
ncbi:hypothetical protein CYCD_25540 [Tenuifilaceae bacterium CYCD]|nr:hypothetical protein CYCD_25540 [Tenuifilaceae bacterium CYCD]